MLLSMGGSAGDLAVSRAWLIACVCFCVFFIEVGLGPGTEKPPSVSRFLFGLKVEECSTSWTYVALVGQLFQ